MSNSTNTVQFRGACSHYKPRQIARISYRYSGFKVSLEDWIGVFPESATSIEEVLLSVSVGEPSSHHLCDGGLFKSGSVSIKFPEQSGGKYRFWYVNSDTKDVLGKSDTFIVCVDEEDYPSMSLKDDQDILAAVNSRSRSASFENVGDRDLIHDGADSINLGSSFILVSEESTSEFPGSDYVMTNYDDDGVPGKHKVNGGVEEEQMKEYDIMHSNEASSISEYVVCPVLKPDASDKSQDPINPTLSSSSLSSQESKTQIREIENSTNSENDPSTEFLNTEFFNPPELNDSSPNSKLLEPNTDVPFLVALPVTTPLDQEIVDMSVSTIETHITQREAHLLKSSSRDLRQKIHKLTEILEENKTEKENLHVFLDKRDKKLLELETVSERFEEETQKYEDVIADLKQKLSSTKEIQKELHQLQKQLQRSEEEKRKAGKAFVAEKCLLEEKVKQLSKERKAASERSSKLVSQLQESETKRVIEKSEKQVLQGKIDYLSSELFTLKQSLADQHTASAKTSDGRKCPPQSQEPKYNRRFEQQQNPVKPAGLKPAELPYNKPHARTKTNTSQDKSEKAPNRRTDPSLTKMPVSSKREDLPLVKHSNARQNKEMQSKQVKEDPKEKQVKEDPKEKQAINQHDTEAPLKQSACIPVVAKEGIPHSKKEDKKEAEGPSEERIAEQLRGSGNNVVVVECPICMRQLYSRENENEYGVQLHVELHVEHCIRQSETDTNN